MAMHPKLKTTKANFKKVKTILDKLSKTDEEFDRIADINLEAVEWDLSEGFKMESDVNTMLEFWELWRDNRKEGSKEITVLKKVVSEERLQRFMDKFDSLDWTCQHDIEELGEFSVTLITEQKEEDYKARLKEATKIPDFEEKEIPKLIWNQDDETRPERYTKGKPRYSWSKIRTYLDCPKAFDFALRGIETQRSAATTKTLNRGRLFEALLFFDKENIVGEMMGQKKEIEDAKLMASYVRSLDIFKSKINSESCYLRFNYEFTDFDLSGEIDYKGLVSGEYLGIDKDKKMIVDIKRTSQIDKIWMNLNSKKSAYQLVKYSWINYLQTGEMLDGLFIIVDDKHPDKPLVKKIVVNVSQMSYDACKRLIEHVHYDLLREEKDSPENCLGWGKSYGTRCAYLKVCQKGRNIVEKKDVYEFDAMPDVI